MVHKAWILYVILAWRTVPTVGIEEQKTLLLEFTNLDECLSISQQVHTQVEAARSMFWLKENLCVPCNELYRGKADCPRMLLKPTPPVPPKLK